MRKSNISDTPSLMPTFRVPGRCVLKQGLARHTASIPRAAPAHPLKPHMSGSVRAARETGPLSSFSYSSGHDDATVLPKEDKVKMCVFCYSKEAKISKKLRFRKA